MPAITCRPKGLDNNDDINEQLKFGDIYLYGSCYIIKSLRKGDIDINYIFTLDDYKVLLDEVGIDINFLWNDDLTFLDKAIMDENKKAIDYLKEYGAKKSCEIFKMKCDD